MERKPPYKPLVHNEGVFAKTPTVIEVHGPMIDYKYREALIFPDRVRDNTKWNLSLVSTDMFKKEAGREIDQFDELKTKYFKSNTRGMGTVKSFVTKTQRAVSSAGSNNYKTYLMSLRSKQQTR